MRVPFGAGVSSDSDKLALLSGTADTWYLKYLLSLSDDFVGLSNWTEVDSGSNVNLAGGVVSIVGTNAYAANGLIFTSARSRAQGYRELTIKSSDVNNVGICFHVTNANAIPVSYSAAGTINLWIHQSVLRAGIATAQPMSQVAAVNDTWYTVRIYLLKDANDEWRNIKFTIEGGVYTAETELAIGRFIATEVGSSYYVAMQRYAIGGTSYAKEYREFSGLATDSPYVTYTADAGGGSTFENFDPTALALPAGWDGTNLKYAWSFDDGAESYSGLLTLAQLNAVSKQTARHRYIRVRAYVLSDGDTQQYATCPNSDTGTDSAGGASGGSRSGFADILGIKRGAR